MKNKTLFIILFCACAMNSFLSAKENLIVFARSSNAGPYQEALEGFQQTLKKENVQYRLVEYDLKSDLEKMFQETGKPDLILTIGSKATETISAKVKDIPIVFSMVMNYNFKQSNIAGISLSIPPLAQFRMLKKIILAARQVGLIYNPAKSKDLFNKSQAEAREAALEIVVVEIFSLDEVYSAVRAIGSKVDVLWMIPDPTVYSQQSTEDILLYSLREKKAVIGISPPCVKAGALFCLSCDYLDIGRQSGEIAWQILQGKTVSEIAGILPRKIDLSLNLITAERIGIKIPEEIIKQAVNVYK